MYDLEVSGIYLTLDFVTRPRQSVLERLFEEVPVSGSYLSLKSGSTEVP